MKRFLLAGVVAVTLACTGAGSTSSRYAGEAVLSARLAGSGPTARTDAPILSTRFEAVGLEAIAEPVGDDAIRLMIRNIDPTVKLTRLIARNSLELAFPDGERLTNAQVARGDVVISEFNGQPTVFITFTDAGKDQFCTLSGAHIEEKVAIRLDGIELSAPVIKEPICGGKAQITLGGDGSLDDRMREAEALAAALNTAMLTSEWTLDSLDTL